MIANSKLNHRLPRWAYGVISALLLVVPCVPVQSQPKQGLRDARVKADASSKPATLRISEKWGFGLVVAPADEDEILTPIGKRYFTAHEQRIAVATDDDLKEFFQGSALPKGVSLRKTVQYFIARGNVHADLTAENMLFRDVRQWFDPAIESTAMSMTPRAADRFHDKWFGRSKNDEVSARPSGDEALPPATHVLNPGNEAPQPAARTNDPESSNGPSDSTSTTASQSQSAAPPADVGKRSDATPQSAPQQRSTTSHELPQQQADIEPHAPWCPRACTGSDGNLQTPSRPTDNRSKLLAWLGTSQQKCGQCHVVNPTQNGAVADRAFGMRCQKCHSAIPQATGPGIALEQWITAGREQPDVARVAANSRPRQRSDEAPALVQINRTYRFRLRTGETFMAKAIAMRDTWIQIERRSTNKSTDSSRQWLNLDHVMTLEDLNPGGHE